MPANPNSGFEPCRRSIAKIAKEGRKYGASLCIVTQRPAEIDPTILSQCNTVFALRMSNDRDQQIVQSAVSDTGSGLLEFLPALGQREAIAFGDGVTLPVRLRFDMLPPDALPRSSTARFSEKWQSSLGDEEFLSRLVERWRNSGTDTEGDEAEQATMLAEAVPVENGAAPSAPRQPAPSGERAPIRRQAQPNGANGHPARPTQPAQTHAGVDSAVAAARREVSLRRETVAAQSGRSGVEEAGARQAAQLRRRGDPAAAAAAAASDAAGSLRSIRERLLSRK